MIIALPNPSWFYRALNAALIALVAWIGAGVFWLIASPAAVSPVAAPIRGNAGALRLDIAPLVALFSDAPAAAEGPSTLSEKLRGVIAASGDKPAVAIFAKNGQDSFAVARGDELEPGVKLVEIASDHVGIVNRGRRERIDLDAPPAAAGIDVMTLSAPQAARPLPPPMSSRRDAARGRQAPWPMRRVTRQELTRGMQALNVNQWSRGFTVSDPAHPGLKLVDARAQPLAQVLGLQTGDVIQAVNGMPIRQTTDISTLYDFFSRARAVAVQIVRNGAPMIMHYRIENQPVP